MKKLHAGVESTEGELSEGHFVANTAVSSWAFGMGLAGMGIEALPAVIAYYAIDLFYPGGWDQELEDQKKREAQVREILNDPSYKETPLGTKW